MDGLTHIEDEIIIDIMVAINMHHNIIYFTICKPTKYKDSHD